jgi:hypothetical protein
MRMRNDKKRFWYYITYNDTEDNELFYVRRSDSIQSAILF